MNPQVSLLQIEIPLGKEIILEKITGEEMISGLFSYRLTLRAEDKKIDFDKLVGKFITVKIRVAENKYRFINGLVAKFIQGGNDEHNCLYYAEIRPWFWKLTLAQDSRIFQSRSALEIIKQVFLDFEFNDFSVKTIGKYSVREYCVQYQETAFNFISRLMEEEGIFYFFSHSEGKHTLILADDPSSHESCPEISKVKLRNYEFEESGPDLVDTFTFERQLTPEKAAAKDFNFELPDTSLLASAQKNEGKMEIYEYPGGFADLNAGNAKMNRRLEYYEYTRSLYTGRGWTASFVAGSRFELKGHDRTDLNKSYVISRMTFKADQQRYLNSFFAFDAAVPYRPSRKTQKPRMAGIQTATVVGKSSEEIWTDNYGRVKVQFHWDRQGKKDENSSCWLRVAQPWAGKSFGSVFIPRVGSEVVVSFLDGDPDRPVIIGSLYNTAQVSPYPLPEKQDQSGIVSRSTKAGFAVNEIRIDDAKGAEQLYFHAGKDMVEIIENEQTATIKNGRTVTIEQAGDQLIIKKGDLKVDVQTGNEMHAISGNFSQDVGGNCEIKVKGNLIIDATGNVFIKGAKVFLN